MRSGLTFLSLHARQLALSISVLLLTTTANLAFAGPSQMSANSSNDQLILMQSSGIADNQPSRWLPVMSNNGGGTGNARFGSDIQLWPGTISYSRTVDWVRPYLQNDLHLGVDYTYQFNFQLRARNSQSAMPQVPDGWYRLDMAVVLPDVKTAYLKSAQGVNQLSPYQRYVTSASLLLQVSGGSANRQITLRFPQLSATTIANHLYVSFVPLQKACITKKSRGRFVNCIQVGADGKPDLTHSALHPLPGYKAYMLDIPFVPYVPGGSGTSNPDDAPVSPNPTVDKSLGAYIASAQDYQNNNALYQTTPPLSPQAYAARSGLVYMSMHDPRLLSWLKQWSQTGGDGTTVEPVLRQIFADRGVGTMQLGQDMQDLYPALCSAMVMTNQKLVNDLRSNNPQYYNIQNVRDMVRLCRYYPDKVMRLALINHIYNFDPQGVQIDAMQPLRFSLQTNFMVSRSHSQDSFTGFSPLEPVYKAFDAIGVPLRALGVAHSVNVSDGRSESESTSGSVSTGLDFNLMPLRIPVKSSQLCLEVRALPRRNLPFFDDTWLAVHNGVYICGDVSNQPTMVGELYAHIFMHSGDTSLVDSYNPLAQSVNIALRGDRDITTFFMLTRQAMTPNHDSRIQPPAMLENAREYFVNTPSAQGNLIVRPIEYYHENVPSFMEMALGTYKESFIDQAGN